MVGIILMAMIVVQATLVWHARHVAQAAARDGLEAARGLGADNSAGQTAARAYLHDVAPRLIIEPAITTTRTATTVHVVIRARVLQIIPGPRYAIAESAAGPIERFVTLPVPGPVGPASPPGRSPLAAPAPISWLVAS